MKILERNCRKRINANEAYDIIMNIKKERDLEYGKKLTKNLKIKLYSICYFYLKKIYS